MSRLGNLIATERISRGLSPKDAARLCGVSASYIIDVESGRRIIADSEAIRMLRRLGSSAGNELTIASPETMDDQKVILGAAEQTSAAPKKSQPAQPAEPSDAWLDALGNVVRRVNVLDEKGAEIDKRMLPVLNGKIEGHPADKVFYFRLGDDSMAGFRLRTGDLLFAVPCHDPVDGAIMILSRDGVLSARRVQRMESNRLMLQSHGLEFKTELVRVSDVTILGKCVRAEIQL